MADAPRVAALLSDESGSSVQDVLLRLGRLADDHPEVAELGLNPVIVADSGPVAVDARVRLAAARAWDPYLRRLR